MSEPWFLAGQTLADGEVAACNARMLTFRKRQALKLCLSGERLDYCRRLGWQHPTGSLRIEERTIVALEREGLLVVVARTQFKRHARLTRKGDWYARTLVTDLMGTLCGIFDDLHKREVQP